jgi:hypothetical protein
MSLTRESRSIPWNPHCGNSVAKLVVLGLRSSPTSTASCSPPAEKLAGTRRTMRLESGSVQKPRRVLPRRIGSLFWSVDLHQATHSWVAFFVLPIRAIRVDFSLRHCLLNSHRLLIIKPRLRRESAKRCRVRLAVSPEDGIGEPKSSTQEPGSICHQKPERPRPSVPRATCATRSEVAAKPKRPPVGLCDSCLS